MILKKLQINIHWKTQLSSILFKKDNDVRVISRITIKDKVFLKNKLFENII